MGPTHNNQINPGDQLKSPQGYPEMSGGKEGGEQGWEG